MIFLIAWGFFNACSLLLLDHTDCSSGGVLKPSKADKLSNGGLFAGRGEGEPFLCGFREGECSTAWFNVFQEKGGIFFT